MAEEKRAKEQDLVSEFERRLSVKDVCLKREQESRLRLDKLVKMEQQSSEIKQRKLERLNSEMVDLRSLVGKQRVLVNQRVKGLLEELVREVESVRVSLKNHIYRFLKKLVNEVKLEIFEPFCEICTLSSIAHA